MAAASHTDGVRGTEKKLEAADTQNPGPLQLLPFSLTGRQKWPVGSVKLPTFKLVKAFGIAGRLVLTIAIASTITAVHMLPFVCVCYPAQ